MRDEDAFQARLDELLTRLRSPDGEAVVDDAEALRRLRELRLVFADWLDERGDRRAVAQRWLAGHGKWPYDWSSNRWITGYTTFDWYSGNGANWTVPAHCHLPTEVWSALDPDHVEYTNWSAWPSRREAEDALAAALTAALAGRKKGKGGRQ